MEDEIFETGTDLGKLSAAVRTDYTDPGDGGAA